MTTTMTIISGALSILASALMLLWALKMFKVEGRNYGYSLLVAAVTYFVSLGLNLLVATLINPWLATILLLAVTLAITWVMLIKYKIPAWKMILIWLIWTILNWIVGFILVVIMGVISGIIAAFTN